MWQVQRKRASLCFWCVSLRAVAGAILGIVAVTGAVSCGPPGSLEAFLPFIPTGEELEALEREQEAFNELVENLPSVAVRIINNTSAAASIDLVSGMSGPQAEFFEELAGVGTFAPSGPPLSEIDSQGVLVSAGGTVDGRLKCGDVLGISAVAPFDLGGFSSSDSPFGLFVRNGNVQLGGIGVSQDEDANFTGDVVSFARFVNPEADGLDCTSNTLVIRIESTATKSVYDDETGELITSAAAGTGTIGLE